MGNNIYQKIQNCRAVIKASDLKKAGRNDYSKYDYYTPEQVDKLVYEACVSEKLFNKFQLKRNEHGIFGELTVIDLESGEDVVFELATAMPEITATNDTQKMGGCMTYANRYLLMNVYDIVDNNLDFDAQKPSKNNQTNSKQPSNKNQGNDDKPWLNENMTAFSKAKEAIANGTRTIDDIRKVYKVSKKIAAMLESSYGVNQEQDNELPF